MHFPKLGHYCGQTAREGFSGDVTVQGTSFEAHPAKGVCDPVTARPRVPGHLSSASIRCRYAITRNAVRTTVPTSIGLYTSPGVEARY
jgi:hypothetical protein